MQPDTGMLKQHVRLIGVKVKEVNKLQFTHEDKADNCRNLVFKYQFAQLLKLVVANDIVDDYTMAGMIKLLAYKESKLLK